VRGMVKVRGTLKICKKPRRKSFVLFIIWIAMKLGVEFIENQVWHRNHTYVDAMAVLLFGVFVV
jgi:hypothetical protein